jgi:hypothetical protein
VQPYLNLSGNSGVAAYETAPQAIAVQFGDGAVYVYTWASAGRSHVEQMKRLAQDGRGLSAYIVRHVRGAYDSKF